jgi:transposase
MTWKEGVHIEKPPPEEDAAMVDIARKKRKVSSSDIAMEIKCEGTEISASTVRRRLNESGLFYLAPLKKPLLTETARENRMKWAKEMKTTDWSKVMFTDETTVEMFQPPTRVWRSVGEEVNYPTVKHPYKVHVWGCFCASGFGSIYCFTENLDSDLLCTIYKKTLFPSFKKYFREERSNWMLQCDNDPKHNSNKTKALLEEEGVTRLPWPSYSPDQNPIENVWHILKSNIAEYQPTTAHQLIKAIKTEWGKLTTEYATHLAESMSNRIQALLSREGDYTIEFSTVIRSLHVIDFLSIINGNRDR